MESESCQLLTQHRYLRLRIQIGTQQTLLARSISVGWLMSTPSTDIRITASGMYPVPEVDYLQSTYISHTMALWTLRI